MNPSAQWENDLAANDQEYYQQLYQYEGLEKKKEDIELFLSKAKQIPRQQLNQIIGAAYQNNGPNFDNKKSFYMALKLIACAQHNINPSSPILSTDTPLPSFEDYDLITNKDRQKYIRIFHAAGSSNGYLNGQDAMKILMRSKLPVATLSQIWNLSDVRQEGKLDIHGFIIAMHYVAKCMSGNTTLPESKVPRSVLLSAFEDNPQLLSSLNINKPAASDIINNNNINTNMSTTTASPTATTTQIDSLVKDNQTNAHQLFSPINSSTPWFINDNEYAIYVNAFKNIDTQNHGYIEGGQAVGFFNHSKLPPTDLANVWDLADTKNVGRLNVDEFAIAMHLIRRLIGGSSFSSFPSTLQNTLLSQVHAKPEPPKLPTSPTSPKESHEILKAKTAELQNNIKKEQIVISGLNDELEKQDEVLNTLRKTVKTLEENLQQTINQKTELQNLLNSMKKAEVDKRHKIATLEREYNNNQSEIKSLKAMHQQQLVFANVSDKQLAVAQQQRDRSVEELALAQDGQFDKLPDSSPPLLKQNIPKPPPPSSRHHRTPSVKSANAASNTTSTRKPPAPPPSKKNRASVVNMPLSPTVAVDRSIREDDENEIIASPSSAVVTSVPSAIDSSNLNMDSIVLSEPQKEQSSSTAIKSPSIPQQEENASSSSIQNDQVGSKDVNNNIDQQKQQNIIPENKEEEESDDDGGYSSDASSEAATDGHEISTPESSEVVKSEATSTPVVNQNENASNDVNKVKENNNNDGDDKSSVVEQPETTIATTIQTNNDKEISEDSNVNDSVAKGESCEINTNQHKEIEIEDSKLQQDIAKATTEVITNNGNNIESQPINIAKDNSKLDDHTTITDNDANDDDHKDNDKKEEPNSTKNIDDEIGSPQANINNEDDEILKPIDQTTHLITVSELASKTENDDGEKQQQQKDDKSNKEIKPTNDSNNVSNTPSAGSLTSTKGDDHDFEVVENTSTSSSFMSASMGIDDDAMDEFDAAFAEALPDAKVVTSNNNTTTTVAENDKQASDKIKQPTTTTTITDNLYDVDDFDKAFGNKEPKPTPATANTTVSGNDNQKNDDDDKAIASTTQNEQAKKDDPFWVDNNASVKTSFEESFTSGRSNNKPKTDFAFGDAFNPSGGFGDAFIPSSGFGDVFTSSGFGDSFTTTTPSTHQDTFVDNANNNTVIKNINNNNNNSNQVDNNNNDLFSSINESPNILEQNKLSSNQSSLTNPFEEFVEKNNVPIEISQQQQPVSSSIFTTTQGNVSSEDKNDFKGITEDQNRSTEQSINTTNTTPSIVPKASKSTGSTVSQQKPSSLLSSSSSKKVEQKQQSTKHSEDDHQSSSASKGKHKGLFSLSSMLPKGKKSKSKSKSNKKEKSVTNNNTISQSTATLSSLHSHNSSHSNNNHANDYLENSLPQLTEQEVMANLRDFGNDTEAVTTIVNMGFTPEVAKEALKRYDYDVTKALNFLLDQ